MSFDALITSIGSPKVGTAAYKYRAQILKQTKTHIALLEDKYQLRKRYAKGGAEAKAVEKLLRKGGDLSEVFALNANEENAGRALVFGDEVDEVRELAESLDLKLDNSLNSIFEFIMRHVSPSHLALLEDDDVGIRRLVVVVDVMMSAKKGIATTSTASSIEGSASGKPKLAPASTPAPAPGPVPTPAPAPAPATTTVASLQTPNSAQSAARPATSQQPVRRSTLNVSSAAFVPSSRATAARPVTNSVSHAQSLDELVRVLCTPKLGRPAYKHRAEILKQTRKHIALLEDQFQLRRRFEQGGTEAQAVESQLRPGGELSPVFALNGNAAAGGRALVFGDEIDEVRDVADSLHLKVKNSMDDIFAFIQQHVSPTHLELVEDDRRKIERLVSLVDAVVTAMNNSSSAPTSDSSTPIGGDAISGKPKPQRRGVGPSSTPQKTAERSPVAQRSTLRAGAASFVPKSPTASTSTDTRFKVQSFDDLVRVLCTPKLGRPAYKHRAEILKQTRKHIALLEDQFQLRRRFEQGGTEAQAVESQLRPGGELSPVFALNGNAAAGGRALVFGDEIDEVRDVADSLHLKVKNSMDDIFAFIQQHVSPTHLELVEDDKRKIERLVMLVDIIVSKGTPTRESTVARREQARGENNILTTECLETVPASTEDASPVQPSQTPVAVETKSPKMSPKPSFQRLFTDNVLVKVGIPGFEFNETASQQATRRIDLLGLADQYNSGSSSVANTVLDLQMLRYLNGQLRRPQAARPDSEDLDEFRSAIVDITAESGELAPEQLEATIDFVKTNMTTYDCETICESPKELVRLVEIINAILSAQQQSVKAEGPQIRISSEDVAAAVQTLNELPKKIQSLSQDTTDVLDAVNSLKSPEQASAVVGKVNNLRRQYEQLLADCALSLNSEHRQVISAASAAVGEFWVTFATPSAYAAHVVAGSH